MIFILSQPLIIKKLMFKIMEYITLLKNLQKKGTLDPKQYDNLEEFCTSFARSVTETHKNMTAYEPFIIQYLQSVIDEIQNPFSFEPFHKAIRAPLDYYRMGLELFRPLVVFENSEIRHSHRIQEIERYLAKGENVILLANHQTEPDPQIISLMLEQEHPHLAEEMIFVAGHRVVSDPLAVPFSKGRNLLCIFSKKHIENPPELKQQKQLHNQRTMHRMSELLKEGGKCIYVAPSGGRDRADPKTGVVEVAPFDPQSVEMFWLMAQHSGKPTHFYPLTLWTYDLLPPPQTVDKELGERRYAKRAPVHLAFGPEVDMVHFPGSDNPDKKAKRIARSNYIWDLVKQEYHQS
jgi:glycerol-3-phosphate O-acyltransferase